MHGPSPRVRMRDTHANCAFAPIHEGVLTHSVKIVGGGGVHQSPSASYDGEPVDDPRLFTYGVRHWHYARVTPEAVGDATTQNLRHLIQLAS